MNKRLNYIIIPFLLIQQATLPFIVAQTEDSKKRLATNQMHQKTSLKSQETSLLLRKANHKLDKSEELTHEKKSFFMIQQELAKLEDPLLPKGATSKTEFGNRLKKISGVMLCGTRYQETA